MTNVEYYGKRLSLYNIARYMLGYEKLTEDVHKQWCDDLEEKIKTHRRIVRLKPRGTYKTTIYNVSFVIDRLIQDYVDHNGMFTERILIASATNELAEQILYEIKQHLMYNENLIKFFDPYGNKKLVTKENLQEIVLYPRKIFKEPNVKAKGALSSIVSEHFSTIIVDDLCFDDKTEVLTNNGWKLFKDLDKENDLILTFNNETNLTEYQKPVRYIAYHYNGEMHGIKHKTVDILTTKDHNYYVKLGKRKEYDVYKSSEIYGKSCKIKKKLNWVGEEKELITLEKIEYKNGRINEKVTIKMDDFLPFLAWYLAEGCLITVNGHYNGIIITQSVTKNPETCEVIEDILKKLPYNYKKYYKKDGCIDFKIHSSQLATYLSQFGHMAVDKFIPPFVKELTPRQISLFLKHYYYGDGHRCKGRGRAFTTFSERMANDLQELVLKSGMVATVHKHRENTVFPDGRVYNTFSYCVYEIKSPNYEACVRKENWYKIQYDGMVYCVEVPNHIIYVRRNGKTAFISNCNSEDRESAAVREKKKRWLQDLISVLEPDGLLVIIGTRWHDDDVYNYIFEMNKKLSGTDKYDIEVDSVIDSNGNPKYPTIYDREKIETLKIEKGFVEFANQYLNEPLPGETQLFSLDNFHFYDDEPTLHERVNSSKFKNCDHFIYVDPALGTQSDYCIAIVGAVKDHSLFIRDVWMSNVTSPENAVKKIEYLYNQYDCKRVGVESNGFQSLFAKYLKDVKSTGKGHIRLEEIKNYRNKRVRIESVEPFVTSGKVLFRKDWMDCYPEFINQIIRYPVHRNDDAPDALEGIVRMTINRAYSVKNSRSKKLMVGALRNDLWRK